MKKLGVPDVLVGIIKSFHTNMRARVRVDGELLEEIEVNNGLRQGCTMAPILFNLYACMVAERWLDRVQNEEGVGTLMLYKLDQHVFHRSSRNACEMIMREFADDVVLMASTRQAAEAVFKTYVNVTQ